MGNSLQIVVFVKLSICICTSPQSLRSNQRNPFQTNKMDKQGKLPVFSVQSRFKLTCNDLFSTPFPVLGSLNDTGKIKQLKYEQNYNLCAISTIGKANYIKNRACQLEVNIYLNFCPFVSYNTGNSC